MQLNCPACGATFSLDAIIGHDGARDAVLAALQLPAPLGKTLIQYLALFRPAQRALSMDRLAKLLNELLPMISTAQIERSGTRYAAPVEYWRQAMDSMVAGRDKLTLPLKSHGYLLEIIAGFAEKTAAKAERQSEQGRKYGEVVGGNVGAVYDRESKGSRSQTAPTKSKSVMPAETRATLRKLTGKANP